MLQALSYSRHGDQRANPSEVYVSPAEIDWKDKKVHRARFELTDMSLSSACLRYCPPQR